MLSVEEQLISGDEPTRRAERRLGQLVRERWHLDAVLGVGGMAAVYAATHRNGKRVALKMLHTELSDIPEMKRRFVAEGYAANRVEHPGAVSVIDDDVSEDGAIFLVMDLLEGETLERRAESARLAPEDVLTVMDALLDVLAAAHDRGVVHRDVKPDNIFITRDGSVKLLDFGIAYVMGHASSTPFETTMGTPAFMPPEQARGRREQLDGRTDLWAVGATMFVQLAGHHVHEADSIDEERLSAMTDAAPSLGDLAPHLPKPLIALVDRALAFERADRWPNAREMQAEVRRVRALLAPEPSFALIARKNAARRRDNPTFLAPSWQPSTSATFEKRSVARWSQFLYPLAGVVSFFGLVGMQELGKRHRSESAPAPPVATEVVAHAATRTDFGATTVSASVGTTLQDTPASAASIPAPPRELPFSAGAKASKDKMRPGKTLTRAAPEIVSAAPPGAADRHK
jgi:serine/threonine-protein kinase